MNYNTTIDAATNPDEARELLNSLEHGDTVRFTGDEWKVIEAAEDENAVVTFRSLTGYHPGSTTLKPSSGFQNSAVVTRARGVGSYYPSIEVVSRVNEDDEDDDVDAAELEVGTTARLTYTHPASGNEMTKDVEVVTNSHNLDRTDTNEVVLQWESDASVYRATITAGGTLRFTSGGNTFRTTEWELSDVDAPADEDDEDGDEDVFRDADEGDVIEVADRERGFHRTEESTGEYEVVERLTHAILKVKRVGGGGYAKMHDNGDSVRILTSNRGPGTVWHEASIATDDEDDGEYVVRDDDDEDDDGEYLITDGGTDGVTPADFDTLRDAFENGDGTITVTYVAASSGTRITRSGTVVGVTRSEPDPMVGGNTDFITIEFEDDDGDEYTVQGTHNRKMDRFSGCVYSGTDHPFDTRRIAEADGLLAVSYEPEDASATFEFESAATTARLAPVSVESGTYAVPEDVTELIDKTKRASSPADVADVLADSPPHEVALIIAMYELPRVRPL